MLKLANTLFEALIIFKTLHDAFNFINIIVFMYDAHT